MAFFLTRLNVGDYDAWKPAFDRTAPAPAFREGPPHLPQRRQSRRGLHPRRVRLGDDATEARARLLASGILNRFPDKTEPVVVEEAESVRY